MLDWFYKDASGWWLVWNRDVETESPFMENSLKKIKINLVPRVNELKDDALLFTRQNIVAKSIS